MIIEKKTLSDGIYHTDILIEKNVRYITDIATAIKMSNIVNKLYSAVEKLKTLSNEELEIAHLKILDYKGYSKEEKDYLINQIKNIYGEDTASN